MRRALGVSALVALAAVAFASGAEQLTPAVATTFAVGDGAAYSATDRGTAARNGRVPSLPSAAKVRWAVNVGTHLDGAPVVDGQGRIVVSAANNAESLLVELEGATGKSLSVTKLRTPAIVGDPVADGLAAAQPDGAASPVVLLSSGTRVVVTIRGFALGGAPGGAVLFRTRLGGDLSSVPRVGIVPLPGGGFVVARRPELIELDAHGNVVDRIKLELGPYLAARESGEALGVAPNGDLFGWRAGRVPHLYGAFGDKSIVAEGPCRGGLVIDDGKATAPGERRARAVCVTERLVEQLDLTTGARRAALGGAGSKLSVRTAPAIARDGTLVATVSGGALLGLGALEGDLGPFDIPGAAPLASLGAKDGGVAFLGSLGEVAPLIADDGSVAWASNDGLAVLRAGVVTRIGRCPGFGSSSTAGLAAAGPRTLLLGCTDGKLTALGD